MYRRRSIVYGVLAATGISLCAAVVVVSAGDQQCAVPCVFPNPPYLAPLGVNLNLKPAQKKDVLPGEIVDISLFAQRTQGVPTLVAGLEAILTWDSDKLELCGLWNNGPYGWLQSKFADDSAGAVVNAGLHAGDCGPQPSNMVPHNDGDAFYSAIAHFPPPVGIGEAVLPAGTGLLVTTFQFRVITSQPLDATVQILDNLDVVCTTVAWGRGGQCSNVVLACNPLVPTSCPGGGTCVALDAQPGCDLLVGTNSSQILGPCNVPCGDNNNNGITDNSCIWWDCELSSCNQMARDYADYGGSAGACLPDGACDGNDRFHALNCFSNLDTGGLGTTYPCEPDPPSALNVDTAKLGSPCVPDGVCDSNEAFAALNCFANLTSCSCNGPAPGMGGKPVQVGSTRLSARASSPRLRAGEVVSIDVHLEDSVPDLRGYQLHVQPAGGESGRLELMDITVHPDPSRPFAGLPAWEAFNGRIGQMAVGLDGAGVPVAGGAYLATFTYRASPDAAGVFTIEVLADASDQTQRSWLFPTPEQGRIQVPSTSPAMIEVLSSGLERRSHRLISKGRSGS